MTVRPLAAALLAASALFVAACGEDGATPSASSAAGSEDDKVREAQVKFAQCMREQGVDIPDPGAEGGTAIKIGPESGISPEEFEAASKECEKYREGIRPKLSEEQQQEFKEKALEHARCMREQGIDFPDPTFSAEGGAQIRLRGNLDPEDADFKAAQEKCGDPMGGGKLETSP